MKQGLKLFKRGASTGRSGGERPLPNGRISQRKLEKWVRTKGIWDFALGFNRKIHYVEDRRKISGLDFGIRRKSDDVLVGLVDAKTEFKTSQAQDRQIDSQPKRVRCFLVGRRCYLPLMSSTKRQPNGSIWG